MKHLFRLVGDLRLTVTLLALSQFLVFFGTLDQADYGIRHTQERYFESFIAVWQYNRWLPYGEAMSWLHLPMPGGYVVGPLLILNLLAAHTRYFRARWDKAGIVLIHSGVVLLLAGQLLTQVFQEEYFMWLDEGGTGNYLESFTDDELVLKRLSQTGESNLTVRIPIEVIERPEEDGGVRLQHPQLPFVVNVQGYLPNAGLAPRARLEEQGGAPPPPMPFNRGIGADQDLVVWQMEPTFKPNERNARTAIVRLIGSEGPMGTWLVSNLFRARRGDGLVQPVFAPQTFEYQGETWAIEMRYRRAYLPAGITLLEFTHDRYPGTEIPLNFESRVRIADPETGEQRETLIYMNHPLRYAGFTFYQASFGNQDTASMFQVVSNPARWFPYVASGVITFGLCLQFGMSLRKHSRKRKAVS
jgi:hypothetical protein